MRTISLSVLALAFALLDNNAASAQLWHSHHAPVAQPVPIAVPAPTVALSPVVSLPPITPAPIRIVGYSAPVAAPIRVTALPAAPVVVTPAVPVAPLPTVPVISAARPVIAPYMVPPVVVDTDVYIPGRPLRNLVEALTPY